MCNDDTQRQFVLKLRRMVFKGKSAVIKIAYVWVISLNLQERESDQPFSLLEKIRLELISLPI